MLGDDGNQIGAQSALRTLHSALERLFSGIHFAMDDWGERGRPACGFGRRARTLVGQISWLKGFRRDAENGNRDGRAPHSALLAALKQLATS
jgi:hypothetical protein